MSVALYPTMRLAFLSLAIAALFVPSASADPLADRIAALTKDFKGTVVLYAKNLTTGREFGVGAGTRVKTAITIKLPILCTL